MLPDLLIHNMFHDLTEITLKADGPVVFGIRVNTFLLFWDNVSSFPPSREDTHSEAFL